MPPHLNGNTGVHEIKKGTARLRIETRNWDTSFGYSDWDKRRYKQQQKHYA